MVMFREDQLVKVSATCVDPLRNKTGTVKMIESDGAAWIHFQGGVKETEVRHHKVRGQCVLMYPDECDPL